MSKPRKIGKSPLKKACSPKEVEVLESLGDIKYDDDSYDERNGSRTSHCSRTCSIFRYMFVRLFYKLVRRLVIPERILNSPGTSKMSRTHSRMSEASPMTPREVFEARCMETVDAASLEWTEVTATKPADSYSFNDYCICNTFIPVMYFKSVNF